MKNEWVKNRKRNITKMSNRFRTEMSEDVLRMKIYLLDNMFRDNYITFPCTITFSRPLIKNRIEMMTLHWVHLRSYSKLPLLKHVMCLKKLILSFILCHTFISIAVHPLKTEGHLSDFSFLPMFKNLPLIIYYFFPSHRWCHPGCF